MIKNDFSPLCDFKLSRKKAVAGASSFSFLHVLLFLIQKFRTQHLCGKKATNIFCINFALSAQNILFCLNFVWTLDRRLFQFKTSSFCFVAIVLVKCSVACAIWAFWLQCDIDLHIGLFGCFCSHNVIESRRAVEVLGLCVDGGLNLGEELVNCWTVVVQCRRLKDYPRRTHCNILIVIKMV